MQHIESLTPRVQALTGISIREQVPDWVLDRADEVVLSDLMPEALVTRMRRGDIYPAERVERSLANFFRRGNLIALREMALQRVTRAVDRTLEDYVKRKRGILFLRLFESSGMPAEVRNTRQKDAIRSALMQANRPLSPDEILAFAKTRVDGISMATVYRNLNSLVDENWLCPVESPGESTRYEIAGKEHHHHFKCNDCGRMYDMPGCGLQMLPKLPHGFRVTGHEFFMYGVCADCR